MTRMRPKRDQFRVLKPLAKLVGFVPCPHCEERGGLWKAFLGNETFLGWKAWCYKCGWRQPV